MQDSLKCFSSPKSLWFYKSYINFKNLIGTSLPGSNPRSETEDKLLVVRPPRLLMYTVDQNTQATTSNGIMVVINNYMQLRQRNTSCRLLTSYAIIINLSPLLSNIFSLKYDIRPYRGLQNSTQFSYLEFVGNLDCIFKKIKNKIFKLFYLYTLFYSIVK